MDAQSVVSLDRKGKKSKRQRKNESIDVTPLRALSPGKEDRKEGVTDDEEDNSKIMVIDERKGKIKPNNF